MLRLCRMRNCKSRNKKAVWLVDRRPSCHSCMERWLNSHFFDEHSVLRLSDMENDFPEEKNYRYTGRAAGGPVAV